MAQGQVREPDQVIGIVHRDIAESSPLASVTISAAKHTFKVGEEINIHWVLVNLSDHDLLLEPDSSVADVRDADGALPPETDLGCLSHFFSPCYKFREMGKGPPVAIPPRKKYVLDGVLNPAYDLTKPGTYTVVDYVHLCDENGEEATGFFKSNTIKITIE
jgi:hypothetical protein